MKLNEIIQKMESLVVEIEAEDANLDRSVELYGDAIKLAKQSIDQLNAVDDQIKVLDAESQALSELLPE